ncbi:DUF2785 domain-containing protein [Kitasatospora sp. NPDC006697]|uniref:DUF2785 domain-containing protein n=1 Tax=Kitasatospora sp. NPDC006697 TaxID=3364020 RepID=UPI0036A0029A
MQLFAPDFPFPADLPAEQVADTLADLLTSPDPAIRDDQAYTALAQWTREGRLDTVLPRLGDAAADRLTHPEVQARTFAPLVLRCVLARGVSPENAERWYPAFAAWYPAEPDTRGWDDRLGWLHAVAHGADAAAAFATALPHRAPDLLDLCAHRICAPGATSRYVQLEDARLARAITGILHTPDLPEPAALGWLDHLVTALEGGGPGPVPVWAFNIFATLQALHLHLTRGLTEGGLPPHAGAVRERALAILAPAYPWLA